MQIQISVQIQITVQIQIRSTLQIPENAEDWCVGGWAPALCVGRSQWVPLKCQAKSNALEIKVKVQFTGMIRLKSKEKLNAK